MVRQVKLGALMGAIPMRRWLFAALLCTAVAAPAPAQYYFPGGGRIPGVIQVPPAIAGTASIAASTASASVALPASIDTSPYLTVANSGSADAYLANGPTATAAGLFIAAGSTECIDANGQNTLSAITAAGATTINIAQAKACISGGASAASRSIPSTVTQTIITLSPGTTTQLIAANAARKGLRWMNIGSNPMTVAPGASAAVVGQGMQYNGAFGTGMQGGSESFEGTAVPTSAFQAISTLGTTIVVWEGA